MMHAATKIHPYHLNIQDAFDNAVNGDKIRLLDMSFPGDLTFNKPSVTVLLEGGYVSGFGSKTGFTDISGKMIIRDGKVLMDMIRIK